MYIQVDIYPYDVLIMVYTHVHHLLNSFKMLFGIQKNCLDKSPRRYARWTVGRWPPAKAGHPTGRTTLAVGEAARLLADAMVFQKVSCERLALWDFLLSKCKASGIKPTASDTEGRRISRSRTEKLS